MVGRWCRRLGGGVLGAAAVAATALAAGPTADEVAAKVNSTVITRQAVVEVVQALAGARDDPPTQKELEQLTRDALDSLIAFELLHQEAVRRQITVSDADIEATIAGTRARFGNAAAYNEALKQRGMTTADIRRDTRKTLLVDRLLARVAWHDVTVSDEQVRAFYEQNREQFKRPEEIRASHILIRLSPDADAPQQAAAQQAAADLLAKLHGGADFAALAKSRSQDPATAPKGGDLGFFARGTMEPTFEQAAFALQVGALSAVVRTPYGCHIIKLTDRRPAGYAALAEVTPDIKAVLEEEEKRRRQDALVAELKKKSKVEVLPLLKPKAPARK